jgi:hypothetical protein
MGMRKVWRGDTYGEGEEIWMTGGVGEADERKGWSGAEGMVRRRG